MEALQDFETISYLSFPNETTSYLYNRINKQFIKIRIPNYTAIQTPCALRNWEKLIRIQSPNVTQVYYLAAKHSMNKLGRNIIVSSPLQVRDFQLVCKVSAL